MRAFAHDPGEPRADDPTAGTPPADSHDINRRATDPREVNSREVNSREVNSREAEAGEADAARDEARLLVQSPRKLFFYWRFARDPRPALVAALGDAAANLRLSVRLVEPDGDWEGEPAAVGEDGDNNFWFDALPGRAYRAEVGFHAAGLPFVRLLSSGAVETPAAAVSPEGDAASEFRIGEREFARVLEGSGFSYAARGSSSDAFGTRATSPDSHAPSSPGAPASRGRPPSDASLPSSSSRATSPARRGEDF